MELDLATPLAVEPFKFRGFTIPKNPDHVLQRYHHMAASS
jgi:hypothetical protein